MKELLEAKIKEMRDIMEAGLTKSEFLEAFKKVTEFIKAMETKMNGRLDSELRNAINQLSSEIARVDNEHKANVPNFKKWVIELLTKSFVKHQVEEKFKMLDEKVAELEAYEPPNPDELVNRAVEMSKEGILPLIPIVDKIEEKLPEMADKIVDAIREKLKIEDIKGLKTELDGMRGRVGGVAASGRQMFYYDLSASLNGVTKTFSIPTMGKIITVHLSSVPNILRPTTDFTHDYANNQITFTSEIEASTSLATGQTCIITYSN